MHSPGCQQPLDGWVTGWVSGTWDVWPPLSGQIDVSQSHLPPKWAVRGGKEEEYPCGGEGVGPVLHAWRSPRQAGVRSLAPVVVPEFLLLPETSPAELDAKETKYVML